MKKIFYLIGFMLSVLCGTFVLTGCQDKTEVKDEMYQKDGFYFPIETRGCEVESATLRAEMSSSKIVVTDDKEELDELLTIVCKKQPEYVGTMTENDFQDFYFNQEETQGFVFSLFFSSKEISQALCYEVYITTQGAMYYQNENKQVYRYTENNFIDYEAISVFFHNWEEKR